MPLTLEPGLETPALTEDPVEEATEVLLAAGVVVVGVLTGVARAGVAGFTGERVVVAGVARAVVAGVVGTRRAVEAVDEAVDEAGAFLTVGVVATGFFTVEGEAVVVARVVEGVVLGAVDARVVVGVGLETVEVGLALLAARAVAVAARRAARELAADGEAGVVFLTTVLPGLAGVLLDTEALFAEEAELAGLAGLAGLSGTEVGWSVGVPGVWGVWDALRISASSTMALGLSGSSTTLSRPVGVPGTTTSSTSMSDINMLMCFVVV